MIITSKTLKLKNILEKIADDFVYVYLGSAPKVLPKVESLNATGI
jgi:hypothetical protein